MDVFVFSRGEYGDNEVVGVFSSEKKAHEYERLTDKGYIDKFVLDAEPEFVTWLRRHRLIEKDRVVTEWDDLPQLFRVCIEYNPLYDSSLTCETASLAYRFSDLVKQYGHYCCIKWVPRKDDRTPPRFSAAEMLVLAKDREDAIRVAREIRTCILDSGHWPEGPTSRG